MDGRFLREIGWNGKIIIEKGNSKKVSNNDQKFRTYATECKHTLYSRPLVYIDDNIRSTEAITPSHFLCLNPRNSAPTLEDDGNPDFKPQTESADELLEIWKKGQTHMNEFWKHWHNDYLLCLRVRYQTRLQEPRIKSRINLMVGQIVHIKEDAPRSKWKMGKIVQMIESRDNYVPQVFCFQMEIQ